MKQNKNKIFIKSASFDIEKIIGISHLFSLSLSLSLYLSIYLSHTLSFSFFSVTFCLMSRNSKLLNLSMIAASDIGYYFTFRLHRGRRCPIRCRKGCRGCSGRKTGRRCQRRCRRGRSHAMDMTDTMTWRSRNVDFP
jgi:hypothetical protein